MTIYYKRLSVEINLRLLWFCFTTLCDLLAKLAPLSQPMRNKTKTNRDFLARIFLHLVQLFTQLKQLPVSTDWFIALFLRLFWLVRLISSNGFDFTTLTQLKNAPNCHAT